MYHFEINKSELKFNLKNIFQTFLLFVYFYKRKILFIYFYQENIGENKGEHETLNDPV